MFTTKNIHVPTMLDSTASISYGVIHWFDNERGFGFVSPADGGQDVFLDFSEIIDSSAGPLHAGRPVSYQVEGTRHWPTAAAVHVL